MKRRDLISHLVKEGCVLHHEGSKHSVFFNPENGHITDRIIILDNLGRCSIEELPVRN